MSRSVLAVIVAALVIAAAVLAYQLYEQDRSTLEIDVGPSGVTVDPPG